MPVALVLLPAFSSSSSTSGDSIVFLGAASWQATLVDYFLFSEPSPSMLQKYCELVELYEKIEAKKKSGGS